MNSHWTYQATALYILAICLICDVTGIAHAQQPPDTIEAWVTSRAIPIRTVELEDDASDLIPFKSLVGTAPVVVLGEPTHGAHQPLEFRNRLFKFLVEQMGFTAIAIETGFTESRAIDHFVAGGPGNVHRVVESGMSWGFGQFQENHELIQWMREYNDDSRHTRKIHFYGVDLSGAQDGVFPLARRPVDSVLDYLASVDSTAANGERQRLAALLDRFSTSKFSSLTPAEQQRSDQFDELTTALKEHKSSLVTASSSGEYEWELHNIAVAKQLRSMFEVSPTPAPGIPPGAFSAVTARNSAMADNIHWALQQEGPQGRVLVFAHNMHAMNAPLKGGTWSVFREPPSSMGQFLRGIFGAEVVIIGAAAGSTSGGLPPLEPDPDSVDAALSKVAIPNFVIDLRLASEKPSVVTWLSQPRSLHANLTTHTILVPSTAFDAMFFASNLSPAQIRRP